jgi:hypothetical protein
MNSLPRNRKLRKQGRDPRWVHTATGIVAGYRLPPKMSHVHVVSRRADEVCLYCAEIR